MKSNKSIQIVKKYWPLVGIIAVVGIYAYGSVRKKKIYKKLMAELERPTLKYGTVEDLITNAFNENYYKNYQPRTGLLLLSKDSADLLADKLHKAIKPWADNEQAIYEVFSKINSKVQVSMVSDYFRNKTGKRLYDWLLKDLTKKELQIISDRIKSLPDSTFQK
jgi:hypothetical protein